MRPTHQPDRSITQNNRTLRTRDVLRRASVFLLTVFAVAVFSASASAATYYSQGSVAPSTLGNWNTNRLGGGTAPANFTTAGDIFVIQGTGNGGTSPHSMVTTAVWTVGAAGSKLQIESGASLQADHAVTIGSATAVFQIDSGGTYTNNFVANVGTSIFAGVESFGATSNFIIRLWGGTATSSTTGLTTNLTASIASGGNNYFYGNLTINTTAFTGAFSPGLTGTVRLCTGDLAISSTGSGASAIFRFATVAAGPTVWVLGSYSQATGTKVDFNNNGAQTTNTILSLQGNFTLSGTASLDNAGSGFAVTSFVKSTGVQTVNISSTAVQPWMLWTIGDGTTTNTVQLLSSIDLTGTTGRRVSTVTINANAMLDLNGFTLRIEGSTTGNVAVAGTLQGTGANSKLLFSSSSTSTTTLSGAGTINGGNLTVEYVHTGAGVNLISRNLSIFALTVTNGTVRLNNTATQRLINLTNFSMAAGTLDTGSVDVSGNITSIVSLTGTFNKTGGSVSNTSPSGISSFVFNGGGAQGWSNTGTFQFATVSITNNSTLTLNTAMAFSGVTGPLLGIDLGSTVTAGTQLISTSSASGSFSVLGKILTANANGVAGLATTTFVSTNTPTVSLGANSTVEYTSAAPQNITAGNYANLASSNAGGRTLPNGPTVAISKTFTPGTNAYTIAGSTIEYNGTAAQALPAGFTTYNNLTLNNTAGTTGVTGLTVNGLLRVQAGTFTSATQYANVQIDAAGTLALSGAISVSGNWTNNGTFTANGFGVTFNGTANESISGSSTTAFAALSISNTGAGGSNTVTLAQDISDSTLNITNGILDQGTSSSITSGAVTVSSGASWANSGTGDLTLSGGVSNAGSISFNGAGSGCPQTDEILIRSSSSPNQRAWSGTGTFSLTDVDVQDQAGTAIISVRSGTDSGNNGLNWLFVAQCNAYTWSGAVSTDWTNPLNWSPSRIAAPTDILYFGAGTPSPIVTNVAGATGGNTETIAELHITAGVTPTFSTGGANTLNINAGPGNTGLDVSNLAVTGANALTIQLVSGTLGTVGGTMSFGDGGHRLIGQAAGAISFGGLSIFSTQSGFTGNAFGDGSNVANGAPDSVRFKCDLSLNCSLYIQNAGGSPFGASGNPSVVTFESGTTARFLTASGFDANGRTYSNLAVGDGVTAVSASDTGAGNFRFDNLEVNSNPTTDSSLTYTGTGAAAITIGGAGIYSTGVGTGSSLANINLTAPGGFTLSRAGTITIGATDTARAINLDGNVTVTNGTTVDLQRVMLLGLANPNSKTVTVNYTGALTGSSTGYVVGSVSKEFGGGSTITAQSFPIGTTNGYSPIDVTNASGTGSMTMSARGTALPGLSGANKLSRYWSIASVGVTQADLQFNYVVGDVVGTEGNYKIFRKTGGGNFTQFDPTSLDTNAHFATLSNVTGFSDWTLAEPAALVSGTISFLGAPYSDSETNADHVFNVTVQRTGGSDGAVDVNYNITDGTATVADNDYSVASSSGTLHWDAGDASNRTLAITVKGDTTFEPDETVNLSLSSASGASISGLNPTTLTITNDDASPCAPQATVYVDDDWALVAPGTDPDSGGPATNFGCDSFATIQGGVNGVTSGGTVIVRAGTYPESVLINKPVSMQGAQAGQNANTRFAAFAVGPDGPKANPAVESIVTAAAVDPNTNVSNTLKVNASNVTIDGFVVDGNNPALGAGGAVVIGGVNTHARRGIQTQDAAPTPNFFAAGNTTIRYNVVQNFAQRGVQLINGNASNTAPATSGSSIDQNVIRNFGVDGIALFFNAHADVTNNTITCGAYPNVEAGIWVQDFLNVGPSIALTIANNNVTVGQDNFAGIWVNLAYLPDLNINNNTVNAAAGVTGASDFTYGIYLTSQRPGSDASLSGNIVGSSGGEFARGIALWNLGSATPTAVTGGTVGKSLKGVSLHDNDPNFGLAGNNSSVNLSGVSIDGTTTGIFVDATGSTGDTVAMEISGNTSIINASTAISVLGANASANIHDNVASIHDNTTAVSVSGGSATITHNTLYANVTGLSFSSGASATAHYNRVISTTTAIDNPGSLTLNLENNWWGCNAGPGNTGCGAVTGSGADFDPWIVLGVSASPVSVSPGGSSTVTADMTRNSAGATPAGTVPDMPVSFSATNGTMMPTSGTITSGQATSTFTSTNSSQGSACAMVDNQNTCTNIPVTQPSFSIDDVTLNEGNGGPGTTSFTFTITKTGAGAASVDYNTVDSSATAPSDYTAIPATPLSFLSADTTKQITVFVNGDTGFEGNETFTVHLSNAVDGTISDADGAGTITNDDACAAFATVYVDDSWVGTPIGSDPDSGGPATVFGCDSFATIQGGVTAVTAGGTVIVADGTYTENVTIAKAMTLKGAQFGVDARGRLAAESVVLPAVTTSPTFLVAFTGLITIDGFSFSGGPTGASGVIFTSVGPNNNMSIANNRFSNYPAAAVWMNRGGSDITIDKNVMDGSNLAGGGQAIFGNGPQSFAGLFITNNNVINHPGRTGLFIDGDHNVGESATRAALISGNLFNNNQQSMNLGSRSFGKQGTPLLGTYAGTISNNTFSNNTANGIQAGIQHVLVTGNTFTNNTIDGLALTSFGNAGADRGAQNSLITGNTFTGSGRAGIFFSGTQGVGLIETNHANLNRIFGNAVGVQYGSTVAAGNNATIDVENNWWGCNFGPGTGGAGCSGTPNGTLVFAGNSGVLDSDPWIVLGVSASPNPTTPGGNSTVTADMRFNSAGTDTSAAGTVPPIPVSFTATNGTMAPPTGTINAGQAMSTFTSTSSSSGSACSMVDSQNICTSIGIQSPSFSIDDVTHMEGNAGTTLYTFTVTKTGTTALPSSVMFTTQDGSATLADNDYQMNSGTLNFTATDTTQQITVLVNGDLTSEPDEAFNVHLSGAVDATISDADGTGTIEDDDSTTISGRVTYQSGSQGVRTITMTLTGNNSFVTRTTMTDSNGDYAFADVPLGNDYTVTPSKTGDVGALHIESIDASNVARYVAGLDPSTSIQQIAADADGDGILTSLDASYIARYVAGLPDTAIVGTWKFQPPSSSYPNLSSAQANQNYAAILVGDTDGNWMPSVAPPSGDGNVAARTSPASPQVTVTVSLPHVPGALGSTIMVPITVGDVTGQAVRAYDLQVTFNAAIVKPCVNNECGGGPTEKPFDKAATLSQDMTVTHNANNTGHLIISAFQQDDLIGSGTLLKLRFHVVGAPGQNSPLTFEDYTDPNPTFHPGFRFNAGNPQAATTNGSVTVNGPTAGASRLSGLVTNEAGEPVGGVTITVVGGPRPIRVITNRDGYYVVEGLETNGFYTVTPARANFVFAPQQRSFSLIGDRTDAVFTGSGVGPDEANPLESPEFFVRQQYLDFLNREPEQAGLDFWSGKLRACGNNDECLRQRRLDVSAAFFISQEFGESGLYLYDLYQGGLGRRPDYAEYAADRRLVVGGPRLEADKAAFASSFVERAEFMTQYPLTMSGEVYVDALLRQAGQASGLDLNAERGQLVELYQTGATVTESRSLVLRSVVEAEAFKQTQYNAGFVLSEYFSYLGRNPDRDGYAFWLNVLNNGQRNNYRGMVCSFVTSAEYQRRFATVIPRSNVECR